MKKPHQNSKPTSLFSFWLFYGLLQMGFWRLYAQAGIYLIDQLWIPSYHDISAATKWRYPAGAGERQNWTHYSSTEQKISLSSSVLRFDIHSELKYQRRIIFQWHRWVPKAYFSTGENLTHTYFLVCHPTQGMFVWTAVTLVTESGKHTNSDDNIKQLLWAVLTNFFWI